MSIVSELEQTLKIDTKSSTLDRINHPIASQLDITLLIKRDDKLHPVISGNKWRKLKYIIAHAIEHGHDHLISMGGAYSNHLHALAWIGKECHLKTTGLIRGEYHEENPTIEELKAWGMNCIFVDRYSFRNLRKFKNHDSFPANQFQGYWIPEGGAIKNALSGVNEILSEINQPFDYMTLACGTGTTLAGLSSNLLNVSSILGFSALNNSGFLEQEVNDLLNKTTNNWTINNDYHFGGFAKTSPELDKFIASFQLETSLPIEPVYTGKMFYGLFDLIKKGFFNSGQTIIAYHSGGLQGARETNHTTN